MLEVFQYKNKPVRTFLRDSDIWFVAKDVCDVLELTNPSEALNALEDDEKMTLRNSEGHSGQRGGAQFLNIISEAGVYKLIFRSNKLEAKLFSRWVTHDVLPQIRKTGSYAPAKSLPSGVLEGAKLIFETAGIKDNQLSIAMDKVYKSYTGKSALGAGEILLKNSF